MRKQRAKHHVAVAAPPGAPIFEVSVPCEVFGIDRPDIHDPWYACQVCPTDPSTILAAGFVASQPGSMRDLAGADTVVVPGCTTIHDEPPPQLVDAVRDAHARGARIVGICSGAFVLAHAGLLHGRRATTHWMHADELARRFADVTVDPAVLYVEDRGVFTSAGTAAGIDLCLELVRQDHGTAAANELARRMVVPPHRDGGQAQYLRLPIPPTHDRQLTSLIEWAVGNLDRQITVQDLAQRAYVSRRTLIRRFHDTVGLTPQQWLLRQRLLTAQDLLETTALTVEQIAERAGMGSAANLRHHFNKQLGVSPLTYRRTFATPTPHGTLITTPPR
jgi:AraC family transcriptional activator FtrA